MQHASIDSRNAIRLAWFIVLLLWPVALLNYLDRQMMAAMKASMVADIAGMDTAARWGFVLGAFKWVYAVFSPIAGFFGDRWNRRMVICASLFFWSIATFATGCVNTFDQLVAARALMGISEAFYIPTALALITDYHRGSTRSRAVGVHQIAIYAGTILGGFAGYAAESPQIGWRFAFTVCGVIGVVYAFPLFVWLRDPPRDETEGPAFSAPQTIRALGSNFNFYLMVMYFTLPALAGWVIRDWMPAILNEQFHLGQGKAGVSAVLYVQLASLVGAGLGGWWADRWMGRSVRGRIYVSALGMSMFLPALFGVGNAGTLAVAVGFLILFGIGWGFFDCNNMPILCQIVRPELRATAYGIMNLVSISCGGFADLAFGILRDREVPLNVIFGVFALVALLSIFIVLCIRPRQESGAAAA